MWKHLDGISLELPDDLPDRLAEYLRRSGEPRSFVAIAGVSRPELGRGSLHEIRILAAAEEEEEWRGATLERIHLAWALVAAGRDRDAVTALRHAVERLGTEALDPFPPHNPAFVAGWILAEGGRFEEALACYRRCLGATRPDQAVFAHLGLTYHELGRMREAAACYERAIDAISRERGAERDAAAPPVAGDRLGAIRDLQRQVLEAQDALDLLRASIGEPPPSKLLATLRDRAQRGEPPGAVQRRDYGVDLAIVDENDAPPRE